MKKLKLIKLLSAGIVLSTLITGGITYHNSASAQNNTSKQDINMQKDNKTNTEGDLKKEEVKEQERKDDNNIKKNKENKEIKENKKKDNKEVKKDKEKEKNSNKKGHKKENKKSDGSRYISYGKVGDVWVENTTESIGNYANTILKLVPSNVRSSFKKDGYKVLVTSKDIARTYFKTNKYGHIIGLTTSYDKAIYISAKRNDIYNSLLHEFGHYVDYRNMKSSNSPEFIDIYNKEKNKFAVESKDGHYKSNQQEFFAEVFQETILHPERCKKTAPRAYKFVKKMVASI